MKSSESSFPNGSQLYYPRRILFITPPDPNYGLDVLYDGLCELLGDDHVVDFPTKPSLHGEKPATQAHYPCLFHRKALSIAPEELLHEARVGAFDLILYGDVHGVLDSAGLLELLRQASAPVVLVDQEDTCADTARERQERLQRPFAAIFKREKLGGVRYAANTFPLPFSYPVSYAADTFREERRRQLFWAGHRLYGLRKPYLEHVERRFGMCFNETFPPDLYAAALDDSRIALSIFGFGFDTVRYWEAPAHGCMLLAERPPIEIPNNFQDGESAVFFDDLADLEEKLTRFLNQPEAVMRIARNGFEHYRRFHTNVVRARYLLECLSTILL